MAYLTGNTFDTFFPQWRDSLLDFGFLDLSELVFADTGAIMCLFFGIVDTVKKIANAVIHLPLISEVRSYWARIGFFHLLPENVAIEPALTPEEHDKSQTYKGHCESVLEMTHITSRDELDEVISRVRYTTESQLNHDVDFARDWSAVLSEVGGNALKHSGESQFIGLMQGFGSGSKRRIQLAIGDDGQGVATSLSTNASYDFLGKDGAAIEAALESGVSREYGDRKNAGAGLPSVRDTTMIHRGLLDIRSGGAKHCINGETKSEWTRETPFLPGTHVIVSLSSAY